MNKYFKFEPVATLASLQVLAAAVLLVVSLATPIGPVMLAGIGGIIEAVFAFFATFVRGAVTPNATLDVLKNLSPEELAKLKSLG